MDMKRKINNQKSEYEIERDLAMGLDGDEDEGESVQPSLYFTNFYRLTFTNCISFYSTSAFFFHFYFTVACYVIYFYPHFHFESGFYLHIDL